MEVAHTQFLQDIPERIILRCPKCKSIYVDDGECESCGFRLGLDRLGDPLGERSYYAISESYLKEHSVFGIELPQLFYSKRKKDKYLRQLNFRFTILLDYFLSDRDCNQVRRRVFWSELKTITWKMVQLGVSHNGIADQVEKHQGHTEYRIVASEIINYLMDCGQMQLDKDLLGRFFSYRVLGLVRVAPLMIFSAITAVIIFSSLSYYQYYFAVN